MGWGMSGCKDIEGRRTKWQARFTDRGRRAGRTQHPLQEMEESVESVFSLPRSRGGDFGSRFVKRWGGVHYAGVTGKKKKHVCKEGRG